MDKKNITKDDNNKSLAEILSILDDPEEMEKIHEIDNFIINENDT